MNPQLDHCGSDRNRDRQLEVKTSLPGIKPHVLDVTARKMEVRVRSLATARSLQVVVRSTVIIVRSLSGYC